MYSHSPLEAERTLEKVMEQSGQAPVALRRSSSPGGKPAGCIAQQGHPLPNFENKVAQRVLRNLKKEQIKERKENEREVNAGIDDEGDGAPGSYITKGLRGNTRQA